MLHSLTMIHRPANAIRISWSSKPFGDGLVKAYLKQTFDLEVNSMETKKESKSRDEPD